MFVDRARLWIYHIFFLSIPGSIIRYRGLELDSFRSNLERFVAFTATTLVNPILERKLYISCPLLVLARP